MQGGVTYEGNTLLSGSINVNAGGNIQPLTLSYNENGNYVVNAPSGVDGYDQINIEVNIPQVEPVLDTLIVSQNGQYRPPSGVAGYNLVDVNVITPSPVIETLNVTTNGTYTSPEGVTGYNQVNVNVPTITLTQPLVKTELVKEGNTNLLSNLVNGSIYYFDIVENKNGNLTRFGYVVKFDNTQKDITTYDFGSFFRLYIHNDRLVFDRVPDYDSTYTCTITLMDSNFIG